MSESLSKISRDLDDKFKSDWVNNFLISQQIITQGDAAIDEEIRVKKLNISQFFDEIANSVFTNLSLFLLQGEYLNFKQSKDKLAEITKKINTLSDEIEWSDTDNESIIDYYSTNKNLLWEKFINTTKDFVTITSQFLEKIESYIKLRNSEILFNIDEANHSEDGFFLEIKGSNKNEVTLLKLITKVSEIDHHLAYKKSSLITLINIHNNLSEDLASLQKEHVYILLFAKTSHLIYKLINTLEIDESRTNELKSKRVYIIGNSYKELDKEVYKNKHLKVWENNLKNHYLEIREHEINSEEVTKLLEKCGRGDFSDLDLKNFHDAVKYSKDIEKSLPNLISINRLFDKFCKSKISNNPTDFDLFSYKVSRNYVANNMFSLSIEQCDTIEKVESELSKVINVQSETGIKNFFPYYKAAKAIADLIEKELRNDGLRDVHFEKNIKRLENSIRLFNKYIILWESYISWCQKVNYLSYRLSQSESCLEIKLDGIEYDLFMASSYILPFNYEARKEELKGYKNKAIQYESYISVLKTSKPQLDNVNKLMAQVNSQERRFIEILAVFSAIVLFTSGSIQVFNKERTFGDSLMFLGVFGISLVLFVILIKSIIKEDSSDLKNNPTFYFKDTNFIASLALSGCIIFGSFYIYNYKEEKITNEQSELLSINEKLPLPKPSFSQKWVSLLNEYELPFILNGNKSSGKNSWITYSPGSSKLLILAPHATSHIRMDSIKGAEIGTGSLAVFLNKQFGVPILYTSYRSPCDPNYYDNNIFKDSLNKIIKAINPTFVIDLHGSEFSKPYDVDLGTLQNKSYLNKKDLFLKLIKTFKSNGLNYVSQDYFSAEKNKTNTKWLFNQNIPCVQLEINSVYLIRSDSSFNKEMYLFKQKSSQILQSLIDFQKIVDDAN